MKSYPVAKMIFCLVAVLYIQHGSLFSQDPYDVIAKVKETQQHIQTVAMKVSRIDTLTTGTIRSLTGVCWIEVDPSDSVFGFKFRAVREETKTETIYKTKAAYNLDHAKSSYIIETRPRQLPNILARFPAAQIVLEEVLKLDTAKASFFECSNDANFFYLTIYYPDQPDFDLSRHYKRIAIDKHSMLPFSVRIHLERLGKVQDTYYEIQDMQINNAEYTYDFSSTSFLDGYVHNVPKPSTAAKEFISKQAPEFNLPAFDGGQVRLVDLKGKVVLLDFWEVWCGPCVLSLPKVQTLYDAYKNNGLLVYGITNDATQLESARMLVNNRGFTFPMLIGTPKVHDDYRINGVPYYVLINKSGVITYIRSGYSEELESAVIAALGSD